MVIGGLETTVDEGLVELITLLNTVPGLQTTFSCEGFCKPPYIFDGYVCFEETIPGAFEKLHQLVGDREGLTWERKVTPKKENGEWCACFLYVLRWEPLINESIYESNQVDIVTKSFREVLDDHTTHIPAIPQ